MGSDRAGGFEPGSQIGFVCSSCSGASMKSRCGFKFQEPQIFMPFFCFFVSESKKHLLKL